MNTIFRNVADEDAGSSKDIFFVIKNTKSLDLTQGYGKIQKPADNQFGKTQNERTWVILTRELHSLTGSGQGFV